MWLSETAVDVPTLEVLAAPTRRVHHSGPASGRTSPQQPGEPLDRGRDGQFRHHGLVPMRLPSGRSIVVFFYERKRLAGDRPSKVSSMTDRPRPEARRALTRWRRPHPRRRPDGESYGHHHRFGEMALASALQG